MKIRISKINGLLAAVILLGLMAFVQQPRHITIYMAGDSTMADKTPNAFPETGWGMPFHTFFDTSVTVSNRAKNGRSTKTFISEGLWLSITVHLQPGDYVLIQFGHNDEVPGKPNYVPENAFRDNLLRFVTETREKGAIPVLITPVARCKFDSLGHVTDTHAVYAPIVRELAATQKVILIDLDAASLQLLQHLGPGTSKLLFNYLKPGEHPNYPDGRVDDTHFNELGARKMASLVLEGIRQQCPDLTARLVKGNNRPAVDPPLKKQ